MRPIYYTLRDREPVVCTMLEWGRLMENMERRRVAWDKVGAVEISTVFLGLDHQHGAGPPLLFETMVFGGDHDGSQDRCSTWEEAERQHRRAVARERGIGLVQGGAA